MTRPPPSPTGTLPVGEDPGDVSSLAADGTPLWDGYTCDRDKELRRRYGLKLAHYNAILAEQGGVCGWCGNPPERGRPLVVDDDHATREIRGLLHPGCNQRLTEQGVAYVLDPPARRVGPFVVPPERDEMRRRRDADRVERRKAKRAAKTAVPVGNGKAYGTGAVPKIGGS